MKHIIGFLFVFFSVNCLYSQVQVEVSKQIETYNGVEYFIHEVLQGQTLYSISREYNVTIDDIYNVNAFAKDGLKVGHFLKIPIKIEIKTKKNDDSGIYIPRSDTSDVVKNADTNDYVYLITYFADEDIDIQSIANQFQIIIDDIINYNKDYSKSDTLYKNNVIRIPVISQKLVNNYLIKKPNTQIVTLNKHIVQKKETLYSISKMHDCSVSDLKFFNPKIDYRINEEQIILFPIDFKFNVAVYDTISFDCEEITTQENYKIALLMPLYYSELDKEKIIEQQNKEDNDENYVKVEKNPYLKSFEYIHFYEGFLIALKDTFLNNAQIELSIYDINNDEDAIKKLINDNKLDSVGLIIGPFSKKPLEILSEWVKEKNISTIDMYFSEDIDYEINNHNIISVRPSVGMQLKGLINFIDSIKGEKNVVFVYNENSNEKILIDFIKQINLNFEAKFIFSDKITDLVEVLSKENENIIVNFTNDQAYLNNFLRDLYDFAEKYPITLFGLPSWIRFESVYLSYLNHFNTHFFSSQFIDYKNENVISFVEKYHDEFYNDPSRLAFLGHDIAKYFLGAITKYGANFKYCLEEYDTDLLSINFLFDFNNDNKQLRNMHLNIYKIEDYKLIIQ